jgi:cold shock CspA family protein
MPQGQVSKWVPGADEGLIMGDDGQEVVFTAEELADKNTAGNLAEGRRVDYDMKEDGGRQLGWNVRLL